MSMTDRNPESATDVTATTHEADTVDSAHDVVFRRVSVKMKQNGGVVGELDGTHSHPLRPNVHLLDHGRQELSDEWKTLDANAV